MGRIAYIADVHVGNHEPLGGRSTAGVNERARMVLETIRAACAAANDAGCTDLMVAGDLMDTVAPSPQLLAATMDALLCFHGRRHLLLGNHEMVSTLLGDHALAPLGRMPNTTLWDAPGTFRLNADMLMVVVPFHPGPAAEWFGDALDAALDGAPTDVTQRCVVTHLGLRTAEHRREPWAAAAHDAIDVELLAELCADRGIQTAYAGNWHGYWEESRLGVRLVQLSALCPTGWDNPGTAQYGWVHFWPVGEDGGRVQIPGPRFVYKLPAGPTADRVFVRMPGVDGRTASTLAQAQAAGVISGWLDAGAAEAAQEVVDRSVAIMQSSGLLERAIQEHIQEHGVPDGLAPDDVAAECLRYLAAGRKG